MKISYFKNLNNKMSDWNGITREERFFCSELFHHLKSNQTGFLSLIKDGINKDKVDEEKLKFLRNIEVKRFDIGFEVCFYRDLLRSFGKGIKEYKLPQKRTFDLALFSEEAIIIIEAKAQQGFDKKQLKDFINDKDDIKSLFKILKKELPDVYIIALLSGNYHPKSDTRNNFDSIVSWRDIAEKYPDSMKIFNRADEIYLKKE